MDDKIKLRIAFEAGVIYANGGAKGDPELWEESIKKGFEVWFENKFGNHK